MMRDIENRQDIVLFVDKFYTNIQLDPLLGPIFASRIEGDWDKHLNRMYDFWDTILFHERNYKGNPFAKHVGLPIEAHHFNQWTKLFKKVINDNFAGVHAEEVKQRVDKMAQIFILKLDHLRRNPNYKSIM